MYHDPVPCGIMGLNCPCSTQYGHRMTSLAICVAPCEQPVSRDDFRPQSQFGENSEPLAGSRFGVAESLGSDVVNAERINAVDTAHLVERDPVIPSGAFIAQR